MSKYTNHAYRSALEALWDADVWPATPLPAVVVCGDTLSGVSSVLAAITRLEFPVPGGAGTRFVIIIKTTKDLEPAVRGTIVPSEARSEREQARLRQWKYDVRDIAHMDKVIASAGDMMGGRDHDGLLPDQLVLTLAVKKLLLFTLVVLPGLTKFEERSGGEVAPVDEVVKRYMSDESNLILAVVSAGRELQPQKVLQYLREYDAEGERTLCVLTKPDDYLDSPVHRQGVADLVTDQRWPPDEWRWHILKTPSTGLGNLPVMVWDNEAAYFAQPPWDGVPRAVIGVKLLRIRLAMLIWPLFISTLPALQKDMRRELDEARLRLNRCSVSREATNSARAKLRDVLENFTGNAVDLCDAALQGSDDDLGAHLQRLAKDLLLVIQTYGRSYEHGDEGDRNPPQCDMGFADYWELPVRRPAGDLRDLARQVVGDAKSHAGQYTEAMHESLFRAMVDGWHGLLQQYLRRVRTIVLVDCVDEADCSASLHECYVEGLVPEVVRPHIKDFMTCLRNEATSLLTPNEVRIRRASEAAEKAWKVQFGETEAQRLTAAFNAGVAPGQPTPQRDLNFILQELSKVDPEPNHYTARQAVALAQQMYEVGHRRDPPPPFPSTRFVTDPKMQDRLREIDATLGSKAILNHLKMFMEDLTQDVMKNVTEENLMVIYPEIMDSHGQIVKRLAMKFSRYKMCLTLLADL